MKNESSQEEINNRELFVKNIVPTLKVLPWENEGYKFMINLNSCPDNSIVNLGIQLKMITNSTAFFLPFNYFPYNATIIVMMSQESIYKYCLMDLNTKGNIFSCYVIAGFANLDNSIAYGTSAGPYMNLRFSISESLTNEVYFYNLNDEKNCNCSIQDLNLKTEICENENCDDNLDPNLISLNQTIYIQITILDDSFRNKYFLIPKVIDLCINQTGPYYKIKQQACINYINFTEVVSNSPGKILLKTVTSIDGPITIHLLYHLSLERILQSDPSGNFKGISVKLPMNVSDSICTGIFCKENMKSIISFSVIGALCIIAIVLTIFFCYKVKNRSQEKDVIGKKDTEKNIDVIIIEDIIPKIAVPENKKESKNEELLLSNYNNNDINDINAKQSENNDVQIMKEIKKEDQNIINDNKEEAKNDIESDIPNEVSEEDIGNKGNSKDSHLRTNSTCNLVGIKDSLKLKHNLNIVLNEKIPVESFKSSRESESVEKDNSKHGTSSPNSYDSSQRLSHQSK